MHNQQLKHIKLKMISRLAQHPYTYSLADKFIRYYFRNSNQSFRIWLHFFLQQLANACRGKKPVVWSSIYTPSELLYAMDVIPIYPEMISAMVASIGMAAYFIETAESNFYLPDLCSFYRVASGMFLRDCLPKPNFIISTSQLCDGSAKFFHNASRYYQCEHFLIDPPYEKNLRNIHFLADELKVATRWISEKTGIRQSVAALAESLNFANQSRQKMLKINRLRETSPVPLSGWNALGYILYMYFASLGSQRSLSFYDTLFQETQNNAERERGEKERNEIRILWLHQLRPYYPSIILQTLTEHKAVIAFEEMSEVYWPEHDPEKPFISLAQKMNANPGAGPIEYRIANVLKLIKRFHIDGVIHYNQRGCRQSCAGAPIMKDIFKKQKIPMLILDGDGIDVHNYSEGQTKTRLEAFLELIG